MALKHGIHSPWMMEHLRHRGVMITSVFLSPFTLEKIYNPERSSAWSMWPPEWRSLFHRIYGYDIEYHGLLPRDLEVLNMHRKNDSDYRVNKLWV